MKFVSLVITLALAAAAGPTMAEPGSVEVVHGAAAPLARLVVPEAAPPPAPRDPKFDAPYSAVCYVEVAENGEMVRRFAVHTPGADTLPLARKAGRFMALLWSAANRRFGTLASGLRRKPVDVWLSGSGSNDAGGEQLRTNIYVYDVLSERTGIEWARELAHEYGHYLLPGASGYTSPESWANGVLGERLFLGWLRDDAAAGRIPASELPFVTPADLDDYCEKQVTPLVERMQASGPDAELLARTDKRGMDAFTALLLYADRTYGGASLMDLLYYLPSNAGAGARGRDFLDAFTASIAARDRFDITLPASGAAMLYLPAGTYRVSWKGGAGRLVAAAPAQVSHGADGWTVRMPSASWRAVGVTGATGAVTLHWSRAGK